MRLIVIFGLAGLFTIALGMEADLYLNKDKFGEFFKLEISEKGCTNVPLNWENQAVSVDTHGSCVKFYDLPYCRGKYVALQPYHATFQDNLETLKFNKIISSASPCGPKVPTGRYYIQNGADGSVLTVETKNNTPVARTHAFRPYISKGQQFQLEKVALSDYEIIPRVLQSLNPLTYDMSVSTAAHPVRRVWKIESVYRGRYIIKNEWNNRCLYKSDSGKVEEHECVTWSPNQEWIFRSIKVKPYFPSKEELTKKPIRPDEKLPFQPQDDAFSTIPYQPIQASFQFPIKPGKPALPPPKGSKKQVQIQRPGPLVINPGEPFPPVFPYPIVPKITTPAGHSNSKQTKPPVPHVRHPGPLPFPAEPVVMDPRVPTVSPLDTYNIFVAQQFAANQAAQNKTQTKKPSNDEDSNEDSDEKGSDVGDDSREGPSTEQDSEEDETLDDIGDGGRPTRGPSRKRPRPGPPRRPSRPSSDERPFDDEYGPPDSDGPGPRPDGPADDEPQFDVDDSSYGPPQEDDGPPPPRRRRPRPPRPSSDEAPFERDPTYGSSQEDRGPPRRRPGPDDEPQYDIGASPEEYGPPADYEPDLKLKQKKRKHQEEMAGVKYSDYRLHF